MDWEDVKTFAEVARDGTVRSAAKALGVHHSTISRRVERLEKALAVRLFDRRPEGYALTEAGEQLVGAAGEVEEVLSTAQRRIAGADNAPCGKVRITMAEPLAVHCFAPRLPEFFEQHPGLDLEISVSYELLDLSRGDAEIAVRMDNNPPESLVGKRLFPYYETAFASPEYLAKLRDPSSGVEPRWLGWGEDDAVYRDRVKNTEFANAPIWGAFGNLSMQIAAAKAGLGLTMLPCFVDWVEPKLQHATTQKPVPARDIWILTHPDLRKVARVRAVLDFAEKVLRENKHYFVGTRSERAQPRSAQKESV